MEELSLQLFIGDALEGVTQPRQSLKEPRPLLSLLIRIPLESTIFLRVDNDRGFLTVFLDNHVALAPRHFTDDTTEVLLGIRDIHGLLFRKGFRCHAGCSFHVDPA